MGSDRMNTWRSFGAAGGVVLGLAFLTYELRQNSDLMRVQILQARADAAMSSNEQFFNSDYLPKILLKVESDTSLSDEERMRYTAWFRAANRNQDNVLSQYKAGMLGANIPRSVQDFVRDTVASSAQGKSAWDRTKIGYTQDYVDFVEETLVALSQ